MATQTAPSRPSPSPRIVPSWFRRTVGDPLAKRLARVLGPEGFGVLWTTRRSGDWRTTALALWPVDGRRYLVALFGETYWVADLRAGRPARLQSGSSTTDITLRELEPEAATDFWMTYARKYAGPAGRYAGISREPDREEAAMVAAGHAVFAIDEDESLGEERPASWRRTLGIGLLVGAVAAIINVVLAVLLVSVTGLDTSFQPVGPAPVAGFTIAGLLAASVALVVVLRRSSQPRQTWRLVATIALVLSWLPDLMLVVAPETPMGTATIGHVLVLVLLHLPAYLLAVTLLPALLVPRPLGALQNETAHE